MAVLRPRLGDGGSLRIRLFALLLVPLAGAGVATASLVVSQAKSAHSAALAQADLRSAVAVQNAVVAFQQEITPEFIATVSAHPELIPGVTPALIALGGGTVVKRLPQLRADTDRAIAALRQNHQTGPAMASMVREIADSRARIAAPATLFSAFATVTKVQSDLATLENKQVSDARGEGLNTRGLLALNDVELVSRAAQNAANNLSALSTLQFTATASKPGAATAWTLSWADFTLSSREVEERGTAAIAQQWISANNTPVVKSYNSFLTSQLSPSPISFATYAAVSIQDGDRNAAYASVLSVALDRTMDAGTAQRDAAETELWWVLGAAGLVALASFALGYWLKQSITAPLDRLAAQATSISEGELTDVAVGGPHEVRTVARALSGTVSTLSDMQAQAAAVASGHLDSPIISQALPGPLGAVMHSSITRIVDAINDRQAAEAELSHRASHDALTELPNRTQALVLVEQALHRAQRSCTTTALMFIDLDFFKAVNDTFGHSVGDQVLQRAAQIMTATVREGDTVARLGGDEFVVLLEQIDAEVEVIKLAERIIEKLSAAMLIEQHSIHIGASVGIAFCLDGHVGAGRLLQEADAAVYRAKNAGRGRVDIFDDGLRVELAERAALEICIADGLRRDEFVLHYQPIIDLTSGDIVGVEALIRWNRPGYGLLAPAAFIDVAELSTLINEIGQWVIHEALSQLALWDSTGTCPAGLSMAVNISAKHMASNQLLADVTEGLATFAIDSSRLVVELTETVLADDPIATRNMQTLRDLGVQISIDDFGTGYTSIGQLPRLPVDTLKIDRSFAASADPAQQELVRLIIGAAHAFGIAVIAEGIEEAHQAQVLRAAAADYGQGFLYARPLPAAQVFSTAAHTELGAQLG